MRAEHQAGCAETGGNADDRSQVFRVLHVGANYERRPRASDDCFQRRRRGSPAAREDAAMEVEADQGVDGVVGNDERGKIRRQERGELRDVRFAEQHRFQGDVAAEQAFDQLVPSGDEQAAAGHVVRLLQVAKTARADCRDRRWVPAA